MELFGRSSMHVFYDYVFGSPSYFLWSGARKCNCTSLDVDFYSDFRKYIFAF